MDREIYESHINITESTYTTLLKENIQITNTTNYKIYYSFKAMHRLER